MKRRSFFGTCLAFLFGRKSATTVSPDTVEAWTGDMADVDFDSLPGWRVYDGCNRSGATNWQAVEVARAVTLQDVNEAVDPLNYLVLPGERRP